MEQLQQHNIAAMGVNENYSKNVITSILPGDELMRTPKNIITHSIIINASPENIWPWLVQLGSGRAGWYSFDRIDNGGLPSAKKIIPELQNITVGDIMPAVPGTQDAFIVRQIIPVNAIVLVVPIQTAIEEPDSLKRMMGPLRATWVLALESLDDGRTKLITRSRISRDWLTPSSMVNTSSKRIFIERIYELLARMPWFIMLPIARLGHSIMESHMLRGIKWRAESKANYQKI